MSESERTKFRTECSNCGSEVGGYIVNTQLLTTAEVTELTGGILTARVIRGLNRSGRLRGFSVPGVRGYVFDAHELFADLERLKRQGGSERGVTALITSRRRIA